MNSFHVTGTRRRDDRGAPPNDINPAAIGVNIFSPVGNFIQASVSGYFSVGCGTCANAHFNVNSIHISDDVDYIHGRHQIAFGVDYIRDQFNSINIWNSNGNFSFNGQYASGKTIGDSLAAFMLGTMNSFTQSANLENATRGAIFALYVQDTIKLKRNLTLNAGLRWDPTLAPYDNYDRGDSFSFAAFNAGTRSSVYTNAPAGLLFYGDPGIPRGFQHPHYFNLSPRLGLVWDPSGSGKQTIRVSSAILRDTEEMFYNERQTTNAPYGTSIDQPFPAGGFTNPWLGYAGGAPFPLPSPLPRDFRFPNAGVYVDLPLYLQPTYMLQWNISYQRQVTPNWLASISYLGNKTTHIWAGEDINPAVYIPGSSASPNLRRPLYLQNPALGIAYSSITRSDQNGNSHYNGLLLSLQHRFSRGFTLLTNYTYSHCISDVDFTGELAGSQYMNPYNRAMDRGSCNFDPRHQSNTSLIVSSPWKGQGVVNRVLGGWQFAPIVSIHSGLPINITDGVDISLDGINLDRPNYIGGNPYLSATDPRYYVNRTAFVVQPSGTFGNFGRDVVTAPPSVNFDFALSRNFQLRERYRFEARAEAFNAINHTNFNGPATGLNSSNFGVITSAGDPRILQFALKLHF